MLDYNYGNRESDDAVRSCATSIVDMQKVYPRDRDLPMLLYWCYTTLQRMTDEQARAAAASSRRSSPSSTRTARRRARLLGNASAVARGSGRSPAVCLHGDVPLPFPIGTIGLAPFVAAYTWKAALQARRGGGAHRAFSGRRSLRSILRPASLPGFRWSFSSERTGRRFRGAAARSSASRWRWRACLRSFSSRSFWGCCSTARRGMPSRVRRLVGGARLRSGRGCPDSSSSRPTRGCSTPSATASRADGTIRLDEHLGGAARRRSSAGSSRTSYRARCSRAVSSLPASARTICLRAATKRSGGDLRARGRDCGLDLCVLAIFPTGDRNGRRRHRLSAGQTRRDGRALRDDARCAARDHRHARRRQPHV